MVIIKLLSFLLLITMLLFYNSLNPIFLCLTLISLSLIAGRILALTSTKWLLIAVMLIFLGGMIVMFIYVTALRQSHKFFFSAPRVSSISTFILLLRVFFYLPTSSSAPDRMQELYHHSFFNLTIIIVFLLWTLFLCVKLVENFKGALKTFF